MKSASVAEMKSRFTDYLSATTGGPVVVTRKGKPVAVLVGVQDEDEIERLMLAYSPRLHAILDRSRQQFREGKQLSEEGFWSQFDHAEPAKGSKGAARPKPKSEESGAEPGAASKQSDDGGRRRQDPHPRRPRSAN